MTGSIDQIDNGRFRLRMYVTGEQQTIGFFDTREEAERAADAHAEVLKQTASDYDGLTLAKLGQTVLTTREILKQVRDPVTDWSRWNTHVKSDVIARMSVVKIHSGHISQWLKRLEQKKLAPQTRRNCLNLMRTVLAHAHEDAKIKANPAHGLRIKGKSEDVWTYLRIAELTSLLEALPPIERHIVGFAIGTGLRAGELVTLRLADVVLDDGRPRILVRYGSVPDLPTKTGKVRPVPLFGLALTVIQSWLQILPTFAAKNPNGLLFPRERGGFRSENHVIPWVMWKGYPNKGVVGAVTRAGITRRFRWHDLRHTCASWLVSGWWGRRWSLQEVKEMLGHTSIMVTQRYAHLAESALEEAARGTGSEVSASQLSERFGAPGETRTPAILFRKQALYPSELPGHKSNDLGKRSFSRLRAGLPPPDTSLTYPRPWVFEAIANLYELADATAHARRLAHLTGAE